MEIKSFYTRPIHPSSRATHLAFWFRTSPDISTQNQPDLINIIELWTSQKPPESLLLTEYSRDHEIPYAPAGNSALIGDCVEKVRTTTHPLCIVLGTTTIAWCIYSASGMCCAVGNVNSIHGVVACHLILLLFSCGIIRVFSSRGSRPLVRKTFFLRPSRFEKGPTWLDTKKHGLVREVRIIQHARHRHVVLVIDAYFYRNQDENMNSFSVIMGRADMNPCHYLRSGRRPRIHWFGCLIEALHHVHSLGIRYQ